MTPYIYQADVWCDSCGESIMEDLDDVQDIGDSGDYPQYVEDLGESDSPSHCGCHEGCLEKEGTDEHGDIPALLTTRLTEEGVKYIKEALRSGQGRPVVLAIWKDRFSDYLTPFFSDDDLDSMVEGYLECALWSTAWPDDPDESCPNPLDSQGYEVHDCSEEFQKQAREDCESFLSDAEDLLEDEPGCWNFSRVGHDFWLTRNGHGAGFWDGDWKHGDELTSLCRPYGTVNLYVGDDGQVYSN